ncbi:MAG: SDR family oxidoreductase [Opitutaceae bacterium]|nr:SDR family oxidoreductase [Opitutaceae bacterium]
MKKFSLANNAALVTGSSKGIGRAIADGLHEAGAAVVYHGNTARPDSVPAGCGCVMGNMLDAGGPARLVADAFAEQPKLDLLVANAGSFFDRPFLEMDEATWDKTMNLNVRATYFLCQAFAKELIARQRPGAMVLVSSTNGFQSEENSTAYDSSKGALVMMTRSLSQALIDHGIRVNGLAPGLIRTPLTSALGFGDMAKHYEKKILLRRLGEPEDCAGTAVFLLSQASAYIVGQVVVVDGGLTVGQIGRM